MSERNDNRLDIAAVREALRGKRGKAYWRGLEEVAETPGFQEWVDDEFPNRAGLLGIDRRQFLQYMGASLALAGMAGCRYLPEKHVVPFVESPEEAAPGVSRYFATALTRGGYATGVIVESNEGRPTKVEGNRNHPASLGASDAWMQAEILGLYDPDRSKEVLRKGQTSSWDELQASLRPVVKGLEAGRGAGLCILTETITSPSLAAQIAGLQARMPEARWRQFESVNRDNVLAGAQIAFGAPCGVVYRFSNARTVVSLGADFLHTMPGSVRYAREFADSRRVRSASSDMSRLYVIESTPTVTGATADHRLPLSPSEIEQFARLLGREFGVPGVVASDNPAWAKWIGAIAADLRAQAARGVVVVGEAQAPIVHAIAHYINGALGGGANSAVRYTEPVEARPESQLASLTELRDDLLSGRVSALIVLGGNPAYTAPADLKLAEAMVRAEVRVRIGEYEDETSAACEWHVPLAHTLESWGDARAFDGAATIQQPLVAPLYGGRTGQEILAALFGAPASAYELVQRYWATRLPGADRARAWERSLHDGVVVGTEAPVAPARLVAGPAALSAAAPGAPGGDGIEVMFAPDPGVWDGRYANNGWLQEAPRPITKLAWDNAALVAPATAEKLKLTTGDLVRIRRAGLSLEAPVLVLPGQAERTVTLPLGYGRSKTGAVGSDVGFNAGALRTSGAFWSAPDATIEKTGGRYSFALTEHHHAIDAGKIDGTQGRDIVRVATLERFREDPREAHEPKGADKHVEEPVTQIYPQSEHAYDGYKWGMSIDLTACIGCHSCVLACQAENNIPVVGKEQVSRGRSMHWIRVDRYFHGTADDPAMEHQPLLCMHCEQAPCEPVCPVAATVHSKEGLNQMVYNRCVGTRYCSNNCPYKVRRFNFLNYANVHDVPVYKLQMNPNVTVRGRGVMEKCSFCVQRINAARITAKKENRDIRDGEFETACQSACPPRAITFGNIGDPQSKVAKLKAEPHDYSLLGELNTIPRLTYLTRVRNPNPALEGA